MRCADTEAVEKEVVNCGNLSKTRNLKSGKNAITKLYLMGTF